MPLRDEWWFSYRNVVAEATLDGGTEIVGFEPENVTNYREDDVWRVPAGPNMTLKGSLAAGAPMQAVIIRVYPGTSWAPSDTATLNFSDVDADSSEVASWTIPLDADPFTGCVAYINATEVTAQFFNLTMPMMDIEYVHIGPLFLPRNFNKGPDTAPEFSGVVERSLFTAQKTVQAGPQTDRFSGQFEIWDSAEYASWRSFTRNVELTEPFAFGASQTSQLNESYIAHLTSSVSMRPVENRWLCQIQLEALR